MRRSPCISVSTFRYPVSENPVSQELASEESPHNAWDAIFLQAAFYILNRFKSTAVESCDLSLVRFEPHSVTTVPRRDR
jgi:hypothetical protein